MACPFLYAFALALLFSWNVFHILLHLANLMRLSGSSSHVVSFIMFSVIFFPAPIRKHFLFYNVSYCQYYVIVSVFFHPVEFFTNKKWIFYSFILLFNQLACWHL